MSKANLSDYVTVASVLQSSSLSVTPAELHGLLVGMLSGGLSISDKSWQPLLFDYTNDGMGWPDKALKQAESILSLSIAELTSTEMELFILLPDDDADLMEMADALSEWVNHFISGLGLVNVALNKLPTDVKEALNDLEEISKVGVDEEGDLVEQADFLEQVIEHVKACALTIHAEFGKKAAADTSTPTIH